MKGSMKEPNMFQNYVTEKITHKASDAEENLQLLTSCLVLLPEIVMQDAFNLILWMSADIYTSCMMISGGFTSDFLERNNRTTR